MSEDIEIFAQLLQASGIIEGSNLDEAIRSAKRLQAPLEQALLSLKLVSLKRLEPVLTAKKMIATGRISPQLASKVLMQIGESGITFEEAYAKLATKTTSSLQIAHPLADYFLGSHLLNDEQFHQALKESQDKHVTIGRTLVVNHFISHWLLGEVIDIIRLVKNNKLERKEAIKALQEALHSRKSVLQVLFESGSYQGAAGETLTLVELLVMAGYLTETDACDLEELEIVEGKTFAEIIDEHSLVAPKLMGHAEALFNMVGNYLKPFQAAEALRQLKVNDISIYQAIAELKPPPQVPQPELRLGDLLVQTGITTREAVERVAANTMSKTTARIGKQMLESELIDEASLYNALRCQSLLKKALSRHNKLLLVCLVHMMKK